MENTEHALCLLLTPVEARIVSALIEKKITTPELYPLTLNALIAACNQKNNRYPVMELDAQIIQNSIYSLQDKRLVSSCSGATSRVIKYRECLIDMFKLDIQERALLCELLLRGPHTVGELKGRASRMTPFDTLEDTLATLHRLAASNLQPLVIELPRQPGRKEPRFAHLLGDQPPVEELPDTPIQTHAFSAPPSSSSRLDTLEARIAVLEDEVTQLKELFATFKSQFE
jgi:uncharacterized protein YceH (UPF0502 family)